MAVTFSSTIYIIGGVDSYTNEVWSSSNLGVNWAKVTNINNQIVSARLWHTVVVSSNGLAIILIGGYGSNIGGNDVWYSNYIACTSTGYTQPSTSPCNCAAG